MSVGEIVARMSDSPLVAKETLARARSWATPVTMALYVSLLGGFALVLFSSTISGAPGRHPEAVQMAEVAFLTMALELATVLLLVPPLAAPAIAAEREQGTLDVLLVGRLSARSIVWGELAASLAYLGLLLVAAVPVLVAVFLYAGLDLGQLLVAEILTAASAVALGAVAVLVSAALPRSVTATVAAYGAALVLFVGVALVGLILPVDAVDSTASSVHPLVFVNPFYALYAVLIDASSDGEHLGRLVQLLVMRPGEASSWGPVVRSWQASLAAQLALAIVCLGASTRLVARQRPQTRPSAQRRRPRADQPATEHP